MKLNTEQLAQLHERMDLLDIDTEQGTARWKETLQKRKGVAKPGAPVTCLVVQDSAYNKARVKLKYLVWLKAYGYIPYQIRYVDKSLVAGLNGISNLQEVRDEL